jgi:hypothetical protein
MTVERDVQEPQRLVLGEVREGVAMDVEIGTRRPAQHAVVDEVGPRERDDVAARGLLPARHADVDRVGVPR